MKVFEVYHDFLADKKVFVVDYDFQADYKVQKVKYDFQADVDNKWYFVDYDFQADLKIFYVDYDFQADMKIYFVDSEWQASESSQTNLNINDHHDDLTEVEESDLYVSGAEVAEVVKYIASPNESGIMKAGTLSLIGLFALSKKHPVIAALLSIIGVILMIMLIIVCISSASNPNKSELTSPVYSNTAKKEEYDTIKRSSEVEVPDVIGMDKVAAEAKLSKLALTYKILEVEDDKNEKGKVFKTDPKKGSTVKENSRVTLYVSKGVSQIAIGDYIGHNPEYASNDLKLKGIKEENIEYIDTIDDKITAGIIVKQNPKSGYKIDVATGKIKIYISIGKEKITLPNFTGITISEAKSTMNSLGFKGTINILKEYNENVDSGKIIKQYPEANEKIDPDKGEITFYVSTGSEYVEMVDFSNMNYSEGQKFCNENGLLANKTDQYSTVNFGCIISSDPIKGVKVKRGSTVKFIVSKGLETSNASDKKISKPDSQAGLDTIISDSVEH
ncbi:MAG: DUF6150 family protein [Lactobacillales bacterium]|jgi:beta-lactam-binding protein with PASTA domain|nr:DUF6150 family protein [Lactobacillales bacterium]